MFWSRSFDQELRAAARLIKALSSACRRDSRGRLKLL